MEASTVVRRAGAHLAPALALAAFACPVAQAGETDAPDSGSTGVSAGNGGADASGARADVEYELNLEGRSVPCWPDVGTAANRGCPAVTSCPAPDDDKAPVVTCHQPQWAFRTKDPVVHLYGKYLVNENGPPKAVAYRDTDTSGPMAQVTREVNVHSACHVSFKLSIAGMPGLKCGDSVEFRLVRHPREPDEPRSATIMTDWRIFKVTEKPEESN